MADMRNYTVFNKQSKLVNSRKEENKQRGEKTKFKTNMNTQTKEMGQHRFHFAMPLC